MRGEDKTMKTEPAPSTEGPPGSAAGIHVVAKPIGPMCNLDCEYCFYLEKKALFRCRRAVPHDGPVLAPSSVGYIDSQPTPVVEFVWQGGEPTLLGIDFFRRVIELQKPYMRGRRPFTNSLQTNGTLLDDEWCRFLKTAQFHGRDQPGRPEGGPRSLPPGSQGPRNLREGHARAQAPAEASRSSTTCWPAWPVKR